MAETAKQILREFGEIDAADVSRAAVLARARVRPGHGRRCVLRYSFGSGGTGAGTQVHLLVPLTLVGMSYALRHGEHMHVDVLL